MYKIIDVTVSKKLIIFSLANIHFTGDDQGEFSKFIL